MGDTQKSEKVKAMEALADKALAELGGDLKRETCCGCGAYGSVWTARDSMGHRLAVKVIPKDQNGAWEREFRGLEQYRNLIPQGHPHLLVIYHVILRDDFFCYSMEAADNCGTETGIYVTDSLARRLLKREQIPLEEVKLYGSELMDAMECLHGAGLVHRDLKPENIVFVKGKVKIADIGLVSAIRPELSLVGTEGYINTDTQYQQRDGISQDIYALGKVLYCLMSGYSVGRFPQVPAATSRHPLFPGLNRVILTACEAKGKKQYYTMREFRAAWSQIRPRVRPPVVRISLYSTSIAAMCLAVWFAGQAKKLTPEITGKVIFEDHFKKETPQWQINDSSERGAWVYTEDGLRWVFRANGDDSLLMVLKDLVLPEDCTITINTTHNGTSGEYRVFLYTWTGEGDLPPDYFNVMENERSLLRDRRKTISRGRLAKGKPIVVERRPEDREFNRLAFVYDSTLKANAKTKEELVVHSIVITVPNT